MGRFFSNKQFIGIILVLFSTVLMSCTGIKTTTTKSTSQSRVSIIIAETSDVHGALFPWDFIENRESKTSLAQVHSWVKEQRAADKNIILVDNGDILQGQPTVYYSNFENVDDIHIAAKVMNYMGYVSSTIGNHDIEAGHPVYDKIVKEFNFDWLAANTINQKTGKPYFKPYSVTYQKDIKVAILGLVTPKIPSWLPENIWKGMEFEDMIVNAKKWMKIIRKEENPDIIIGVFHAGADYTYGGSAADMPKNENASKLVAMQIPGFDAVFVGHDHKGWNTKTDNGVLLMGALNAAKTVAVAKIDLVWNEEKQTWDKTTSGEIVDVSTYQPDAEYMDRFSVNIDEIKQYVSKKVGSFTESISTREAMFGDSPFVDLIHRIQLDITDADVSFAAPLSFDKTIHSGDVFVRDMFKLYKYENLLYTMQLTGLEIKNFLEYSYGLWFNQMKNSNDHLINFKKDGSGNLQKSARTGSYETTARYYNYDSAAGIKYTVDVSKPVGERVIIHSMADGSRFDLSKKYKVAINSYRGNGGGGHLTKGAGISKNDLSKRMLSSTIKDLRYYLMKWIEEQGTVEPKAFGNWSVAPVDWWKKAQKTDHQLLYGMK